jgi:sugar (pentulose or hexulose) kinase
MATTKPIVDPKGRLWSGCHALPNRWYLESNAQESGGAYRWLKGLLFPATDKSEGTYALMDSLAQDVPPGAVGMLAFIGPSVMDMSRLKPSLGGFIFPVTPGVTNIERKHFVRAALENLAFAFKANCAQLEEVSQQKIKQVSIGGGLAQSRCLVKILSDILAMPVTCFESPQVTAWGAAMCAAVGSGVYPDLKKAMLTMRPKSRVVKPDAQNEQGYAPHYERWLTASKWLEDLYEKIG